MKRNSYNYRKLARDNAEITGWFKGCHVHHIDHDCTNDNLSNLICLTKEEHRLLHATSKITNERKRISQIGKCVGKQPWNKGLKGVQVAWNKGIQSSEEQKEKQRSKMIGRIPWNKGKEMSEDSRLKMRKPKSEETKLKISESLKKRNR